MNIRHYTPQDYPLIRSWWLAAKEVPPLPPMLPLDTTFVVELAGRPLMAITLYLTNCPTIAYLENFIKDPMLKDSKIISAQLVKHAEEYAYKRGYKILICLSYKDKLKKRYQELGYINTLNNLSSFAKVISKEP